MENLNIESIVAKQLLTSVLKEFVKRLFRVDGIDSVEDFIDRVARRVIELQKESREKANKLYTAKEICDIYRISPATLERWIRVGLKYENTGSKTKRLFTIENVEKFKTKKR